MDKPKLPDGYQERLLELVEQCQERDGSKKVSLRQLAREMGDEGIASRLSLWRCKELISPVADDSFELLARVDPQHRSSSQLKQWVEGQDQGGDEAEEALEAESVNPFNTLRLFVSLWSDNRPVHVMVERALNRHGHTLDESGVEFFVDHTSAITDDRKVLVKRYLKGQDVASEAMKATWPCVAVGISRLSGYEINGNELEWLEQNGTVNIDKKTFCPHKSS